ncbi:MAG: hypothetical protein Q4P20_04350 [Eubacteriales bacterium]|nr:hypothetical protein [Eubacteriales bacterium]
MKKRYVGFLVLAVMAVFMLCACTRSTYTQEDIGDPPDVIDETTILGRWYFEGHEQAYIDFHEDSTYVTNNEGKEGTGTYTLSDDCMTIHLKEETSSIDEDVSIKYGDDILYFIWQSSREQIFTRDITETEEDD